MRYFGEEDQKDHISLEKPDKNSYSRRRRNMQKKIYIHILYTY